MGLLDVKEYLKDRRQATLRDLSLHFDTEPEVMGSLLEHWIRKGRVTRADRGPACGRGCSGCACDASLELYQWQA